MADAVDLESERHMLRYQKCIEITESWWQGEMEKIHTPVKSP
jgi:hypothetical protein